MISYIRDKYNQQFSDEKYHKMLADILKWNKGQMDFKLAETPIFIDKTTTNKLLKAGEEIITFINSEAYFEKTQNSLLKVATPPNEADLPGCIVMDFAICVNSKNEIEPKLIELQGFPSLFGFEVFHNQSFQNNFEIPAHFSPYLNGYNETDYISHLQEIILGDHKKHTILLELFPQEQKTSIDFYCTQQLRTIPLVCLSEIYTENNKLFYNREGSSIHIERIYNRVVWDEIAKQSIEIKEKANLLLQDLDLEWVTHPNHFYRLSKYIIPFLNSTAVPSTRFLNSMDILPKDLENFVLKPLFSYAGQGVIIDVTKEDINNIKDPENWILQQKVEYAPLIETPTGPAKTEIRLFYFWNNTTKKYIAVFNLARLSKGKMIGVSYNNATTWVGGSIAYFEH